jgi:hypothetical protein
MHCSNGQEIRPGGRFAYGRCMTDITHVILSLFAGWMTLYGTMRLVQTIIRHQVDTPDCMSVYFMILFFPLLGMIFIPSIAVTAAVFNFGQWLRSRVAQS